MFDLPATVHGLCPDARERVHAANYVSFRVYILSSKVGIDISVLKSTHFAQDLHRGHCYPESRIGLLINVMVGKNTTKSA